ncbi:MAG: TonB-dependent receptor [Bacteroidetes bacterium]|nr:TonB-dependent receptor [Bacteroidota bacterium]
MKLYIAIAMVFTMATTFAQECNLTLQGKVLDLHDDSFLVGATIVLAGLEKAIMTDLDGTFQFSKLCTGTYNIQVSHPACTTRGFTINLTSNTDRVFRLEHHLEELNEILIKGSNYYTKAESVLENKISEETLEKYSSGSLGDALKTISGVSALSTGNTVVKPVINGMHSSRITLINNGVRQQDQEWGAEHAPTIDLNTASSITVIKGASALQFSGDAIGGVIIAEPAPIKLKDSLYGKTIFSGQTNGRGGSITTSLIKSYESGWFGRFQGTLKKYGDFEAPNYVLSNTGLSEQDGSFQFGLNRIDYGFDAYYSFFKNEIGILRASHLGGAEDQVTAIESNVPLIVNDFTYSIDAPKQEVTHHLAKVSGFYNVDGLGKIRLNYDFQQNNRLEFDVRRDSEDTRPSVDLELVTHNVSLSLENKIDEHISLKTGIMGNFQKNFADPSTGVRRLIPDYDQYKLGAYVISDIEFSDAWIVEMGARLDHTFMDAFKFYRTSFWESRNYDILFPELVVEDFGNQVLTNPELKFTNFSATIGFSHNFKDDLVLFGNYSLSSRAPNPSELFSEGLHHSASRIELGDLQFNSEVAQKTTLTLQKKGKDYSFSINPYANFVKDFILIEPTGIQQTVRGNFQVWEYRQTNARFLGVDTDFTYAFTHHLEYSNQFSLVKGVDEEKNRPLINMPPAQMSNRLAYVLPFSHPIRAELESTYVWQQNEFPNNNFDVFLPEAQTFETVDVSTPPSYYHILDFNTGTQFKLGAQSVLALDLKITNVLNTSYRSYLNRLRYYADDLGRSLQIQVKINY